MNQLRKVGLRIHIIQFRRRLSRVNQWSAKHNELKDVSYHPWLSSLDWVFPKFTDVSNAPDQLKDFRAPTAHH